jgi:hypothetical protein
MLENVEHFLHFFPPIVQAHDRIDRQRLRKRTPQSLGMLQAAYGLSSYQTRALRPQRFQTLQAMVAHTHACQSRTFWPSMNAESNKELIT